MLFRKICLGAASLADEHFTVEVRVVGEHIDADNSNFQNQNYLCTPRNYRPNARIGYTSHELTSFHFFKHS